MPVLIRNQQRRPIDLPRLRRIGRRVIELEGGPRGAELSVLLTEDGTIRDLNRRYRGVDAATDVLAFSLGDPDEGAAAEPPPLPGAALLGDVVISVETAARQAARRGHSLDREVGLLLAHGVLHLLGWRDATPGQRRRISARGREVVDSL
jgi:probable rRNA maturation factor